MSDKPVTTPMNINQYVFVRLTKEGHRIYSHKDDEINVILKKPMIPAEPKLNRDGFLKIQLWELMSIFGGHMHNGMNIPFERNEILIGDYA